MTSTKTAFALPALLAAALLAPAMPASAAGTDQPEGPVYIPAGYACPDFNVGYTWTGGGKIHFKELVNKDGSVRGTVMSSPGVTEFTYINYGRDPENPVAGKTFTAPTAGSRVTTEFQDDGATVTMTGRNNWFTLNGPDIPGGVSTTLYTGRVTHAFDFTTGAVTLVESRGTEIDLCAELR
jgi:hypothetical protein